MSMKDWISKYAYFLWLKEGCPQGQEKNHWIQAEKAYMSQKIKAHIRPIIIRRDMPEVLAIEAESFEFPWLKEDFIRCLLQRNCIGAVAEYDDQVVGFMIYEFIKNGIQILNFAIAAKYRRRGIGSQMLAKLISKLWAQYRVRITLEVRETNLAAQFFFRAQGFRAAEVLRNFYDDTPEDAYLMEYSIDTDCPANRISELMT